MSIKRLRALYGPFRKYPFFFIEHPAVNELIDAIPALLDIAEAADVFVGDHPAFRESGPLLDALAALESYGEPDDGGRGL